MDRRFAELKDDGLFVGGRSQSPNGTSTNRPNISSGDIYINPPQPPSTPQRIGISDQPASLPDSGTPPS